MICVLFGNNKAVVACFSLVYYAGLFRINVLKYEKFVADLVHLEYSLFRCHGLDGEGLGSDGEIFFLRILHVILGNADAVAELLRETGLVLSHLTLDSVHTAVKRIHKCGVFFFAAEEEHTLLNRHLNALHIADSGELYRSFAFLGEELVELCKLLLNVLAELVVNVDFSCVNGDLHNVPFFLGGLAGRSILHPSHLKYSI